MGAWSERDSKSWRLAALCVAAGVTAFVVSYSLPEGVEFAEVVAAACLMVGMAAGLGAILILGPNRRGSGHSANLPIGSRLTRQWIAFGACAGLVLALATGLTLMASHRRTVTPPESVLVSIDGAMAAAFVWSPNALRKRANGFQQRWDVGPRIAGGIGILVTGSIVASVGVGTAGSAVVTPYRHNIYESVIRPFIGADTVKPMVVTTTTSPSTGRAGVGNIQLPFSIQGPVPTSTTTTTTTTTTIPPCATEDQIKAELEGQFVGLPGQLLYAAWDGPTAAHLGCPQTQNGKVVSSTIGGFTVVKIVAGPESNAYLVESRSGGAVLYHDFSGDIRALLKNAVLVSPRFSWGSGTAQVVNMTNGSCYLLEDYEDEGSIELPPSVTNLLTVFADKLHAFPRVGLTETSSGVLYDATFYAVDPRSKYPRFVGHETIDYTAQSGIAIDGNLRYSNGDSCLFAGSMIPNIADGLVVASLDEPVKA